MEPLSDFGAAAGTREQLTSELLALIRQVSSEPRSSEPQRQKNGIRNHYSKCPAIQPQPNPLASSRQSSAHVYVRVHASIYVYIYIYTSVVPHIYMCGALQFRSEWNRLKLYRREYLNSDSDFFFLNLFSDPWWLRGQLFSLARSFEDSTEDSSSRAPVASRTAGFECQWLRGQLFSSVFGCQWLRRQLFSIVFECQWLRGQLFLSVFECQWLRGQLFSNVFGCQWLRGQLFSSAVAPKTAVFEPFSSPSGPDRDSPSKVFAGGNYANLNIDIYQVPICRRPATSEPISVSGGQYSDAQKNQCLPIQKWHSRNFQRFPARGGPAGISSVSQGLSRALLGSLGLQGGPIGISSLTMKKV